MSATHRAPWGGKSRTREGAAHIVFGMAMPTGKLWASKTQNMSHLNRWHAQRQQVSRDPKIHDAPVGCGEALRDMPSPDTILVEIRSLRPVGEGSAIAHYQSRTGTLRVPRQWWDRSSRVQQGIRLWRQPLTGMHDSHPGSKTQPCAPRRFLIGETGEAPQVANRYWPSRRHKLEPTACRQRWPRRAPAESC